MTPRILLLAALAAIMTTGAPAVSAQPKPAPKKEVPAKAAPKSNARYGNWDKGWGARPPAPPRHFAKPSDWHRHVRACQRAYKSYNARTDNYRHRDGRSLRCRL